MLEELNDEKIQTLSRRVHTAPPREGEPLSQWLRRIVQRLNADPCRLSKKDRAFVEAQAKRFGVEAFG